MGPQDYKVCTCTIGRVSELPFQSLNFGAISQSTLANFGLFLTPTPLRWHFLPVKHWQKATLVKIKTGYLKRSQRYDLAILRSFLAIFSESLDFQFWKKKSWKSITHKWPFLTVFGHLFANFMNIFHKTEVQTVILRCLVSLNLNWIKSYNIILVKKIFFNAWKCIISGLFRRSEFWDLRKKSAVTFSKWLFWQNSLIISWTT